MVNFSDLLKNKKPDHNEHNEQVHAFVTGKSDKTPITDPAKKHTPAKYANSFQHLLSKKDARKKATETGRDVLFGTGLTKKIAEKDAKEAFRLNFESGFDKAWQSNKNELILKETPDIPEPAQPPIISVPIPSDITWDGSQLAALDGIRSQKYACLIGAAGTGKTTVTKQIVSEIQQTVSLIDLNRTRVHQSDKKEMNIAIAFCAFTGRAVQQMKRALPREYHSMCQTVHATLGYAPTKEPFYDEQKKIWAEKLVFRPTFDANNKLPYECIVIDECGMLPINLWNELKAAMIPKCRVIMIGDINQLPPVQGRSVLGFAMIKWPTYTLETIHRQAADNPIIANAHNILNGLFPVKDKRKFAIMPLDGGSIKAFNQTIGVVQQLHKRGLFDPFRDALIVPQNKGALGQIVLNERLVHYFNPPTKSPEGAILNKRHVITAGYQHVTFAVGDKVMLLQNDRMRGLTNGMTGKVIDIAPNGRFSGAKSTHHVGEKFSGTLDVDDMTDMVLDEELNQKEEDENQRQASHIMTVQFGETDDKREVTFSSAGQFKTVTIAYAFTCHKSQGGEYPTVIIMLHSANIRMLTREWLYTAVTRAQERVIILANDRGLAQAIYTQRIKGKTVQEKALQFLALQDKHDTKLPDLPEPLELEF